MTSERHVCTGCFALYAEYHNGCARCWDDDLSVDENRRKYPDRKVVPLDEERT